MAGMAYLDFSMVCKSVPRGSILRERGRSYVTLYNLASEGNIASIVDKSLHIFNWREFNSPSPLWKSVI